MPLFYEWEITFCGHCCSLTCFWSSPWFSAGFLSGSANPPAMQEIQEMQIRKIPWRRAWQPTPVFLPGESRGQKTLADCSPRGRPESDTTEVTEHAHRFSTWLSPSFCSLRQRMGTCYLDYPAWAAQAAGPGVPRCPAPFWKVKLVAGSAVW